MPLPPYPLAAELSKVKGNKGFNFVGENLNQKVSIDGSGYSVSGAGDVNGDGFDDFIIGAPGASPILGNFGAGQSYLLFGNNDSWNMTVGLSNLNGVNGFILNGEATGDNSGDTVNSVGDINGDGFSDFIIAAPYASPNGNSQAGKSYVVFGKNDSWNKIISLSSLSGANGFILNGEAAGDNSGFSASNAGDINGDGINDLIISAPYASSNGNSQAGKSYVLFGQCGGWNQTLELSSLDGTNGFVLNGEASGDQSGISVSSAGDINGDGICDFIVGASGASPDGNFQAGKSYVVFGKHGVWNKTVALSSLNGTNGFVLNGEAAGDYSGFSVSGVGDVNGDGLSDFIISASFASANGNSRAGKNYVIFGNRHAWNKTVALSRLNGVNGFVLNGETAGDQIGASLSMAGDVNGDGLSDFIIGAPAASPNKNSHAGKSYVVFGKRDVWSDAVELSSLNGANGFVISGAVAGDSSGFSVSSAGDVNGDGTSDLIVGAPYTSSESAYYSTAAGCTYIITNVRNLAPSFTNMTQLSIAQGQSQLFSSQNIKATDDWTLDENLQFIISNLQYGKFLSSGVSTLRFFQRDVIDARVLFVHDDSNNSPIFDVVVSDGILTAGPQSAIIDFTPTPTSTNNNTASVIGATVGAILGSAALIGVGALYTRNQADKRLEKAIKENGNGIEQESITKNKILYPIVKKVYEQIKIGGCLGHLTPKTASEFVNAIQALVDAFEKLRMDLDLEKMTQEHQSQLLKEIVRHIRLQTGTSASCCRFFKAEVTPIQIQDKAHAIAQGVHASIHSTQTKTETIEFEENATPYTKLL